MFENRIRICTLLGFDIYIDWSWLIIASLIMWSLATGLFPAQFPDLGISTYVWMGVIGALGLFASLIIHELGHSVVARHHGVHMKGITLFIFGGVAEMSDEPPSARSEFLIAIAGPIVSICAAACFYLLFWIAEIAAWPIPLVGVLGYLCSINLLLAVFNLIPAFPLDGGRVFRAALWGWKHDLAWATRVSSTIGTGFAFVLMILGLLSLFSGNVIGGIWWFILGIFLRNASQNSYQLVLLRQILQGEPVSNFMSNQPITIAPSATLRDFLDHYIYRHHHKFFPVVDNGDLIGGITVNRLKEVPAKDWDRLTVGDLALPCSAENMITPEADAMKALTQMHSTGISRMMVVENGSLIGILSLKDLVSFLALKLEIEGQRPAFSTANHFKEPHSSSAGRASMAR